MKKMYYLSILVLLSGCLNPQKLLEAGYNEKAMEVCLNRLSGNKVKLKYLFTLEEAQARLLEQDTLKLDQLLKDDDPANWPKVHRFLLKVDKRQQKILKVDRQLEEKGFPSAIRYLNTDTLLEEARQKSAIYYYALAQEYLPAARSGDRLAARRAWQLFKDCRRYVSGFRDAPALEMETYKLGITYIRLNINKGQLSDAFLDSYLEYALGRLKLPIREDWLIVHYGPEYEGEAHYELVGELERYYVSRNREDRDCCVSTKEVEAGCKVTKEWSEKDSCYVEVREVIYKEVSATAITTTQEKDAYVTMQLRLVDLSDHSILYEDNLRGTKNWSNEYTDVSGDSRAEGEDFCPDDGGMSRFYPHDDTMIKGCMSSLGWRLRRVIQKKLPVI